MSGPYDRTSKELFYVRTLESTHRRERGPPVRLALALAFAVALAVCWASAARAQDGITAPPPLAALIAEAMEQNQELRAAQDKARALRDEAPFHGSLQDPRVGLGLSNVPTDTFELDQEAMTQKQVSVSQRFPWFGTLGLAEKAAVLRAVEQEHSVRAMRLEIARKIAEAWYDLGFTARALEVNAQLEALVTQTLRVAETRYATGSGLQQDILSAQVRLSELLDERVTLERKQRTLTDRINALLNREGFRSVEPPVDAVPPGTGLDTDTLAAAALAANPSVAARSAAVDRAELDVELAQKDYMPDMDVRLAYGQRDDDPVMNTTRPDFLSASVTFSVPLWQEKRQDSRLAAQERRLSAAHRGLAALKRELPHRIDALVAEIDGARENSALFEDALTVQAGQLAESSLAAYSVGKVAFDTMLAARVRLLRFQLKADRYRFDALKRLAALEEIVGGPLAEAMSHPARQDLPADEPAATPSEESAQETK